MRSLWTFFFSRLGRRLKLAEGICNPEPQHCLTRVKSSRIRRLYIREVRNKPLLEGRSTLM